MLDTFARFKEVHCTVVVRIGQSGGVPGEKADSLFVRRRFEFGMHRRPRAQAGVRGCGRVPALLDFFSAILVFAVVDEGWPLCLLQLPRIVDNAVIFLDCLVRVNVEIRSERESSRREFGDDLRRRVLALHAGGGVSIHVTYGFAQRFIKDVIRFTRFLQSDNIGLDPLDRARQIIGIHALYVRGKNDHVFLLSFFGYRRS